MVCVRIAALTVATVIVSAQLAAAPDRLISGWVNDPLTIDGVLPEWTALTTWPDAELSIGVRNDDRSLYLAIGAPNQARKLEMLAAGVIVWLDATGGKKRSFGIRVPGIGISSAGRGTRSSRTSRPVTTDLPPLTYFEIAGPKDDDRRRIERASTKAIQVARDQHGATLVLELQIPLAINDAAPFAIGTQPGRIIGLGVETPKIEQPEVPPEVRGRGRGGMGGGMGRGGRRGGRGGMERLEPLKEWTTVQLASGR